jgi:hypothetical protein
VKNKIAEAAKPYLSTLKHEDGFSYVFYFRWLTEERKTPTSQYTRFKAELDVTGKYFVLTHFHRYKSMREKRINEWKFVIPEWTLMMMVNYGILELIEEEEEEWE